ncbi:NADH dehydrogenase [ubiquinone] 1 beta subcomplex subunit 3-B-like [Bidens hawaiensis]|uniref:NADH dehydrogenase [ubiquinone] 1 beta subcomplex subunit 3-B-like n=1 Tax=Bidens hawaiensis TaxID=980011 RepID=UPI0040496E28
MGRPSIYEFVTVGLRLLLLLLLLLGEVSESIGEREREREMGKEKKALGATGEFFRRRDAWRSHPMLTNQFRHATPGLGIALVAFGVYVAGEFAYNKIYATD